MTVGLNGLKVAGITPYGVPLPNSVEITATYPSADEADFDGTPGVAGATQWKEPVRAATTASITIATALNAGDSLDGVTLAAGDRVLVKDQGTAKENGIYVVDPTPYRAGDLDDDTEVLGAVVYVIAGTTNAGTAWKVTNTAATVVDTDAINWAAFGGSGGGVTVSDEGTPLSTTATTLDFVGAGVTATGSGATKTITIPGGSGLVIEEVDGSPTNTATKLKLPNGTLSYSGTEATYTPSGSAAFAGARVYNSSNVALTATTETTITFNSERYDTDGYHDTSSNTSRLTIPTGKAGKYHIGANVSITTSPGTPTYIRLRLNGTTVIAVVHVPDNASFVAGSVTCDYDLAEADYVEFQVYVQNSSKNALAAGNYSPEFWLHKIN